MISDNIFRYNGNWTQRYSDPYLPRLEGGVGIGFCDADVMNCLFENNRMGVYINNFGDFAVKTQFQPSIIGLHV